MKRDCVKQCHGRHQHLIAQHRQGAWSIQPTQSPAQAVQGQSTNMKYASVVCKLYEIGAPKLAK